MIWELKGLTGANNNVCKIRFAHKFRPELKGKNTEWEKIASFLPLENTCREATLFHLFFEDWGKSLDSLGPCKTQTKIIYSYK